MTNMIPMGRPKGIVVHYSFTDIGSVARYRKIHVLGNGWSDVGYHFVIGNGSDGIPDGGIEIGRALKYRGAHTKWNNGTVGICLTGKFEDRGPSKEQLESLVRLCAGVCMYNNFDPMGVYKHHGKTGHIISGHRDWRPTLCPGQRLYDLLPLIRVQVKDQFRQIIPQPLRREKIRWRS